ncbi:hypothetical protein [Profundibacterium mesophilum]|uniref:Uncharacterized protein n=1 Tax=Profundibacterium mesophilum KAUST100406-0324 TaxID=1037889 RepID=A0A921NWN5_9RHOB|nr:hypothetical protein [Profundibacterium mesophilum]KAF0676721.1 hypothetical protein PMES_00908 [Profundibacterium mesophilum KAUST100406-0324]
MTDVTIKQGDTLSWLVTIEEEIGDLATMTPRCDLRSIHGQLRLTAVIVSAADRTIALSAPASATARLPPGLYRFDVELASPGGVIRSSVTKTALILEDVTRV